MNRGLVGLIVGVICVVVLFAVGLVVAIVLGIFKLMDRTDAHVCGLAYVQRSPDAARLLGIPIVQDGFTGGKSQNTNGELYERLTFNVSGPRGKAFVLSEGSRSPLASHLRVQLGRDQRSITVYNGPFDCPELHAK
jgi:hypothetical protein